ncbi:MAG: hypothetical protein ABI240_08865 [Sphingomonas sp.]
MAATLLPRLGSAHLDDLAIVVLTTPAGSLPATAYPELDQEERTRLRSRLKLIGRHDWPSSMRDDPLIRRGYTLRQCCRLVIALTLLDAQVPPSAAIPIARNHEATFLRIIASRLSQPDPGRHPDDLIAVILLSELWERLDPQGWTEARPSQVRTVRRSALGDLWLDDLDIAGQRLIIDIGGAALTMWRWMRLRDLMTKTALPALLAEVERLNDNPEGMATPNRSRRR